MKNMKKVASLGVAATLVAGGLVVTPAFAAGGDGVKADPADAAKATKAASVDDPSKLPLSALVGHTQPQAPEATPADKDTSGARGRAGDVKFKEDSLETRLENLNKKGGNFPTPTIGTKNPNKVDELLKAYEAVNNNVKATIKGKKAEKKAEAKKVEKKVEAKKAVETSAKKGHKTSAKSGHLAKTGVATGALAGLTGLLGAAGVAAVRRSRRA